MLLFFNWRRKWQPTLVLLPGKSHGWRSLVDYSPWGRRVGQDGATSLSLHIGRDWDSERAACRRYISSGVMGTLFAREAWFLRPLCLFCSRCSPPAPCSPGRTRPPAGQAHLCSGAAGSIFSPEHGEIRRPPAGKPV